MTIKKALLSILLIFMGCQTVMAQFNPGTPPSPGDVHKLTIKTIPAKACAVQMTIDGTTYTQETENGVMADAFEHYLPAGTSLSINPWYGCPYDEIKDIVDSKGNSHLDWYSTSTATIIFKMPKEDLDLTIIYKEKKPSGPMENYFDSSTGTLYFDNFEPGYARRDLAACLKGFKKEDVLRIIVSGKITDDDYHAADPLGMDMGLTFRNVGVVDYSRTDGGKHITANTFVNYSNVNLIYLPACVETIAAKAFNSKSTLTAVTCFAVVPPVADKAAFYQCANLSTIFVPEESVDAYKAADVWKDYNIEPIPENIYSLQLSVPKESHNDLRNSFIELTDKKSGRTITYVIGNRLDYIYHYLPSNTTYTARIVDRTLKDLPVVCSTIDDIVVDNSNVSLTFSEIKKKRTVTLKVLDPDGQDVTSLFLDETRYSTATCVEWFYKNKRLSGERDLEWYDGEKVTLKLTSPLSIARYCSDAPEVEYTIQSNDNNALTVNLESLGHYNVTGIVVDDETGEPVKDATVALSQQITAKSLDNAFAITGDDGKFSARLLKKPLARISVTCPEYAESKISSTHAYGIVPPDVEEGATFSLDSIRLKSAPTTRLIVNYDYNKAVASGSSEDVKEAFTNSDNIVFTITDETTEKELKNFQKTTTGVEIRDYIAMGDKLTVKAHAYDESFDDVNVEIPSLDSRLVNITVPLTQHGGIKASFSSTENTAVVAMLFNSEGRLVQKKGYSSSEITFPGLKAGNYTVVTMAQNQQFNGFNLLSQMAEAGLQQGVDYLLNKVSVQDGKIVSVHNSTVPVFNAARVNYIASDSYFNLKAHVNAGAYATLYNNLVFKPEYKTGITDVRVEIVVPENLQYVAGSAMTAPVGATPGTIIKNAAYSNGVITIPVANPSSQTTPLTRFCVVPNKGGKHILSANARFNYMGKEMLQPIGTVTLEAEDVALTIDCEELVNSAKFKVVGTLGATFGSNAVINIYDDGKFIGTAKSTKGGEWQADCELQNPYNLSVHNIYAEVTLPNGYTAQSKAKAVTYNIDGTKLKMVTMYHYNPEVKKEDYVVHFDYVNFTKPESYTYYIANPNYSFTIDFEDNDTTVIKNVTLYTNTMDGAWHKVPTVWSESQHRWMAIEMFAGNEERESNAIQNVGVEYMYNGKMRVDQHLVESEYNSLKASMEGILNPEGPTDAEFLQQLDADINAIDAEYNQKLAQIQNAYDNENILESIGQLQDLLGTGESSGEYTSLQDVYDDLFEINKELAEILANTEDIDYDVDSAIDYLRGLTMDEASSSVIKISDTEYYTVMGNIKIHYKECNVTDIDLSKFTAEAEKVETLDGEFLLRYVNEDAVCLVNETTGKAVLTEIIQDAAAPNKVMRKSFFDFDWFNPESTLVSIADNISKYGSTLFTVLGDLELFVKQAQIDLEANIKELADLCERQKGAELGFEETLKNLDNKRRIYIESFVTNFKKMTGRDFTPADIEKLDDYVTTRDGKQMYKMVDEYRVQLKELNENIAKAKQAKKRCERILSKYGDKLKGLRKGIGYFGTVFGVISDFYGLAEKAIESSQDIMGYVHLIENIPDPCPDDQQFADILKEDIRKESKPIAIVYGLSFLGSGCIVALNSMVIGVGGAIEPLANALVQIYGVAVGALNDHYYEKQRKISKNLYKSYVGMVKNLKCYKKDDDEEPKPSNPHPVGTTPIIDPSGFVYEGVTSNRVEGATATIYYKESKTDMYGDPYEEEVLWNAEEYAQQNPLFTDADGMYQWDVPQGLWQVRITKDGYAETRSEWLPVPPPQLDVNLAINEYVQPEVTEAHVYENGAEITFSKYMDPKNFTRKYITLTAKRGDESTALTDLQIEMLDATPVSEGDNTTYATRWSIKTDTDLSMYESAVISVAPAVTSYCGSQMRATYTQELDIEKQIRTTTLEEQYVIGCDENTTITIAALPADAAKGRKLQVSTGNSVIAEILENTREEDLVFDENGQVSFTLKGSMLGLSALKIAVEGTTYEQASSVSVVDPELLKQEVLEPVASRISGTEVYRGQSVTLSSEQEGVKIYYTLDGSCPCDENARLLYDGTPITITGPMTIKTMAVGLNNSSSEIAEYSYGIRQTSLMIDAKEGWNWASHSREDAMPVAMVETNSEIIKTHTAQAVNDPTFGLFGTLTEVVPDEMFMLKSGSVQNHVISGDEYNASANHVTLADGWTWLGYPLNQTMAVGEALEMLTADEGDVLKSHTDGFVIYFGGEWFGNLETMTPGKGYMYFTESPKAFVYNNRYVSNAKSIYGHKLKKDTHWTVNPHAYPKTMPVIASLGEQTIGDGDTFIAAFCGDECRGVGIVDNTGLCYLTVYGEGSENMTFRSYNSKSKEEQTFSNQLAFSDNVVGTPAMPYVLGNGTTGIGTVAVEYDVNTPVYNMAGQRVKAMQKGVNIIKNKKIVKK